MFDKNQFQKFTTSTTIDGNYVGIYNDKIIRIIEANQTDYKELLNHQGNMPSGIKSESRSEAADSPAVFLVYHN